MGGYTLGTAIGIPVPWGAIGRAAWAAGDAAMDAGQNIGSMILQPDADPDMAATSIAEAAAVRGCNVGDFSFNENTGELTFSCDDPALLEDPSWLESTWGYLNDAVDAPFSPLEFGRDGGEVARENAIDAIMPDWLEGLWQ